MNANDEYPQLSQKAMLALLPLICMKLGSPPKYQQQS